MARIIIMGASSGIGYALAEAFASRGVNVGIAARHTSNMKNLKEKFPDYVEYASIDITKSNAPELLGELISKLGGMDLYIHVAGIGYENADLDPQREVDIINTNAAGFARMISSVYRYFRDTDRHCRIAAVTSVAGTNGIGRLSAYSASKKCAQTYLTAIEQLANTEKVPCTITDIRPGWIKTPLLLPDHTYPFEMSLTYALPQIIRAITKHPRVAYIDWRWGLISRLWKRVPDRLWVRMNIPVSSPEIALVKKEDTPFPSAALEQKNRKVPAK